MSIWIIQHHHRHGDSVWPVITNEAPDPAKVAADLGDDFEPEADEYIEVHGPFDPRSEEAVPTKLVCPKCGNDDPSEFEYQEDMAAWRRVISLEHGTLTINSEYHVYDEGAENVRLMCRNCCTEQPIPEGVEIEWC